MRFGNLWRFGSARLVRPGNMRGQPHRL